MRHKGDEFEFKRERNDDLMRAYTRQIADMRHISSADLYFKVVNTPSERFWVSPRRAAVVISSIIKGKSLDDMGAMKKEMFLEIYKRVLALKQEAPRAGIYELCKVIVEQSAPKFYLTPESAKVIVCRIRKQWFKERRKQFRLFS